MIKLPNDILTLSEKNSILENISLLKISDIKENLIHLQAR